MRFTLPSAAKWNIIGSNLEALRNGTEINAGAVTPEKLTSGAGTSWASQNWTPTVTQSGSVTVTISSAKYVKVGTIVHAWARLVVTGSGTGNNAIVIGGLPFTAARSGEVIGSGYIYNADATIIYDGSLQLVTTTTINYIWGTGTGNAMGVSPNFALASPDELRFHIAYEAA